MSNRLTPTQQDTLRALCTHGTWSTDNPVEIGQLDWLVLKGYARKQQEDGMVYYVPTYEGRMALMYGGQS